MLFLFGRRYPLLFARGSSNFATGKVLRPSSSQGSQPSLICRGSKLLLFKLFSTWSREPIKRRLLCGLSEITENRWVITEVSRLHWQLRAVTFPRLWPNWVIALSINLWRKGAQHCCARNLHWPYAWDHLVTVAVSIKAGGAKAINVRELSTCKGGASMAKFEPFYGRGLHKLSHGMRWQIPTRYGIPRVRVLFFCCCVLGTQFPLDRDSREAGLKADLRLKFLLYFTGPFQQLFPVLLCLTWAANCNFYARRIFRCAWVALLKCWQHCSDCFDVSLLGVKTLLLSSTFFNGVICQMSKYEYTLLRETLNLAFLQLMELSEIKSTANQQKKRKIQSRFSSGSLLLTFLFSFPADCEAKTPSHRNSEKAAAHSHFWQCGKRYWVIIFGPSRHWHPPEIFRENVVICGSGGLRLRTGWLIELFFLADLSVRKFNFKG